MGRAILAKFFTNCLKCDSIPYTDLTPDTVVGRFMSNNPLVLFAPGYIQPLCIVLPSSDTFVRPNSLFKPLSINPTALSLSITSYVRCNTYSNVLPHTITSSRYTQAN